MSDAATEHVLLVGYLWAYKIAALVIGYLFARLGFALFLKGVTGEFKFRAEMHGVKADLVSASPGLFLILMGTIVVGMTLYRGFEVEFAPTRADSANQATEPGKGERSNTGLPKTSLPAEPPSFAPRTPPQENSHVPK